MILVTTKNAETDKVTVTYNGSFSLNSRIVKWEDNIVTDGLEWTEAFYEFYQNDARVPGSSGKVPTTMNTSDISMKDITYLESFRALRESGYDSVYGGVGSKGQYLYYGSVSKRGTLVTRFLTGDPSFFNNVSRFRSFKKIPSTRFACNSMLSGTCLGSFFIESFSLRSRGRANCGLTHFVIANAMTINTKAVRK